MVDLVPIIAVAQRLIKENGRSVTFIEHDETLGDAAKPWQGPTDARATPKSTSVQNAIFVPPSGARDLGLSIEQSDLLKNAEQIMIVSPGVVNLDIFQEVLDEGVHWKITAIEVLRPGALTVLAFVAVSR